ncbi:cytochrome P450 [Sporodiniella umbellata]|nr:cytochrome P450 [Sporodiniella umbellata]
MDIKLLKENMTIIVPTSLALLSVYWITLGKREREKKLKDIPFPSSLDWPVFGHMLSLGTSPSKQIRKWHQTLGPIFKIHVGSQLWVSVGDPMLAQEVFVKFGHATSSRPYSRFLTDLYSKNSRGVVLSVSGPVWKNNRKAAYNVLKPSYIDTFDDMFLYETDELIRQLDRMSKKGIPFNPWDALYLCSLNIIMELVFGLRYENTEDPDYRRAHHLADKANFYGGIAGDLSGYIPSLFWLEKVLGMDQKLKKVVQERDQIYGHFIQQAVQSEKKCAIKELTKIKEQDGSLNDDDILVLTSDMVLAGADSSAITIHWTFVILSQFPEVQAKMAQELDEWKKNNPTYDFPKFQLHFDQLPYSACVQKEILRFRPIGGFGIPHACTEDTLVGDYLIPKGATLLPNNFVMNHSSELYDDPESFRPERFLNNTQKMSSAANAKGKDRDHFTFGWGRRLCLGVHLAERELFNFYVRFFSNYTVVSAPDTAKKYTQTERFDFHETLFFKPKFSDYLILPRNT